MSEGRGGKAASSFLFKLVESLGMQGISFLVNILLARLLDPSDYGVLTMLTVFIAISQAFVNSGLNTALIQKKDVDETDVSSVFWMTLGLAAVLYGVLFLLAPTIAVWFRAPQLQPTLRVLALVLFPGAMVSVQNAVVARRMAFRRQMFASLTATVLSGTVGITMAGNGMGYWALVGQQLTNQCVLAVLLLFVLKWRPQLCFCFSRIRGLIRFGWKLLISSLLDTAYTNLSSFVIGLRYSQDMLGFYARGRQFPELAMNAVNGSVSTILLPVLSDQQDDLPRLKQTMRRSLMLSCFVVMPLMAGLAGVAEPLIRLLLTDKWLPCVPFLQVFCLDFALYPIHTTNLQAINAVGRSDVFLKLEIIKKIYGPAILAISVFCFDSVFAIAAGMAVSGFLSSYVNASPNKKLIGYGYLEQVKDVLPSFALSVVMFGVVWLMGMLPLNPLLLLLIQVVTGAAVYAGLALLFKMESAQYLVQMVRKLLKR